MKRFHDNRGRVVYDRGGELRGDLVVDELVTSKYGENREGPDY